MLRTSSTPETATIEFSAVEWTAMGIAVVMSVVAASILPKYWRGELKGLAGEDLDQWWPFGRVTGEIYARTIHLALVMVGAIIVAVATDFLEDVGAPELWRSVRLAAGVVAAASVALFATIALFNQPRPLVPPPFRKHRGVVSHIARRTRRRRRTSEKP